MARCLGLAIGLLLLGAASAASSAQSFVEVQTPHFLILSEAGQAKAETAAARLEGVHAALSRLMGVSKPDAGAPLTVLQVDTPRDMKKLGAADRVLGYYVARRTGATAAIPAFSSDARNLDQPWEVLQHEYGHHFQQQYFGNRFPLWFVEGFAEYAASIQVEDNGVRVGEPAQTTMNRLRRDRLSPVRKIAGARTYADALSENLYGTGFAMTHYFFSTDARQRGMLRYFQALQSGAAPDEATFKSAIGMGYAKFDKALRRHLRRMTAFQFDLQPLDTAVIAVRPVPAGLGRLRFLQEKIGRPSSDSEVDRVVAEAEQLAAGLPDTAQAQWILARFYLSVGRPEAAKAALEPWVRRPDAPARSLYWYAESLVQQARKSTDAAEAARLRLAARRYYAEAFEGDRKFAGALNGYARSFIVGSGVSDAIALDAFFGAYRLMPQSNQFGLDLAGALITADRYDEAAIVATGALTGHISDATRHRAVALAQAAEARTLPADPRLLWNALDFQS